MDFLRSYAADMLWITIGVIIVFLLGLRGFKKNSGEDKRQAPLQLDETEGRSFQNLTKIYTAQNNAEADLIKAFLGQHEIEAFIRGYAHRSLLGFVGSYVELDILVPEEEADRALKIIEEQLKEGRKPQLSLVKGAEEPSKKK